MATEAKASTRNMFNFYPSEMTMTNTEVHVGSPDKILHSEYDLSTYR